MKAVFLSLVLVSLCVGTGELSGQTVSTLYTFNGLAAADGLGIWVGGAGDVNKDGYPDLIVSVHQADPGGLTNAGQAMVFSGKDGSTLYTFNGLAANDNFGLEVATAGDVNNDGFADLLVGAHKADPGGRTDAGQATVFSGQDGSVLYTLNGLAAGDCFGRFLAPAGDVNQDNHADFMVAAFKADPGGLTDAGQVTVFSGKDGSVLYTFNGLVAGDQFGLGVASAGDVNKDGFPDFIVGAPHADPNGTSSGQVRVFSGKDGSVLYTFNGLAASDYFGYSAVAEAGDVNRDGYSDVIVGAYAADPGGLSSSGQVTVFSGQDGSVLYTFNGLVAGDCFGYTAAGAGDVNRDGFPDFVVGAHGALSHAGQVRVFSGKDGSVLHTFNGLAANDEFGISVAGPGDVNKDGFPDLLVGAWYADPGSLSNAGQATVFSVVLPATLSGSGSPSIGGTVHLHLLAPGDGNLPYQVGSSLGTGPIRIDTRLLGLSLDDILLLSVSGVFPGVFSAYSGILDNSGQATAALKIPMEPALVGYRIHSAFVSLDPSAPSNIKSISNTFPFAITK